MNFDAIDGKHSIQLLSFKIFLIIASMFQFVNSKKQT